MAVSKADDGRRLDREQGMGDTGQGQVCSEAVTRAGADYCKTINNSWTSHYSPKLGHRIQSPPSQKYC